jgi:all-trans-8'-apo-beta-carotenal 15,15'-oxygenase
MRFLAGLASYTECLEWSPDDGNTVLLIDLATGEYQSFEAPPAWTWHMGNAYEHGDDVVVDFVGYDNPGHFLGTEAQLAAVMRGEQGVNGAPGTIRRYILSRNGQLTESVIADGNFEFPSIDWRTIGSKHERLYVTTSATGGMLHTGIAALNTATGTLDSYDFGPLVNAGEPIFAADPRRGLDEGWLITQTLDLERGTSGFSLLDAQNVAAGPVASVELGETMPISFHGQWVAA